MPNEGYTVRFKKSAAKELRGLDLDLPKLLETGFGAAIFLSSPRFKEETRFLILLLSYN